MLGRSIGISDEKLAHLADDPLPEDVYTEVEAAVIRYAQKSTRMQHIDDGTYSALAKHFSIQEMIDISFVVGLANMVNRINATFLPELDDYIVAANKDADRAPGACPMHYPPVPA
ncbi:MAG TPA: hypothetical protein VK009_02550 [Chloroflexota bacterium]|nr:hypothetical protein [Chloroflexota bacterium]